VPAGIEMTQENRRGGRTKAFLRIGDLARPFGIGGGRSPTCERRPIHGHWPIRNRVEGTRTAPYPISRARLVVVTLTTLILVLSLIPVLNNSSTSGASGALLARAAAGTDVARLSSGVPVENISIANASGGNLSSFWGVNFLPQDAAGSTALSETQGSPLQFYHWPGGAIADRFNMSNGTEYAPNGTALTNESQFVAFCKPIHCHAIFQVPGEINDTKKAAWEVNYTIRQLGYQPDYWEIGDEPALWTHFNKPWPQWKATDTYGVTPATYAKVVQRYILAMKDAVAGTGVALKFIGLPGIGQGSYREGLWINQTVALNGPNISAVAIHVYAAGTGATNPSLTGFFDSLQGKASIPVRVPLDRQNISGACRSCAPIQIFVDELGSGSAGGGNWTNYMAGYPQVPFMTAEFIQGMEYDLPNLDLYALRDPYQGSLFDPSGNAHPLDMMYTQILPHFESVLLNTAVIKAVPNLYVAASESTDNTTITLLASNANPSTSVQLSVSGPRYPADATYSLWHWDNLTPTVQTTTAIGPTNLWTLPPQGVLLVSVCAPTNSSGGGSGVFSLAFCESGLPSGSRWWVNLTGTHADQSSASSSEIVLHEPNGTYNFSIATSNKTFRGSPGSGELVVGGSAVSRSITFSRVSYPTRFTENGLPAETPWWVNLTAPVVVSFSGKGATIGSNLSNGTYGFQAASADKAYAPVRQNGTFTVDGAPRNVTVNFTAFVYAVTFSESGLPPGTNWSVTLDAVTDSSTGTDIHFSEPNGSHAYSIGILSGYSPTPKIGSVVVHGGPQSQSIVWAPTPYFVRFSEAGLPTSTRWTVELNGTSKSSYLATIGFDVGNGTFSYIISPVAGFTTAPYAGFVNVTGHSVEVDVNWTQFTYAVTFNESGLTSGTDWSVNLNGTVESSITSTISFFEPNGSYNYSVGKVRGTTVTPASGTVDVQGGPASVNVTYSPPVFTVSFVETGLQAGTNWSVALNGTTHSSTTTTIPFEVPNGSDTFLVSNLTDYTASPASGTVMVNGHAVNRTIAFEIQSNVSNPWTSNLVLLVVVSSFIAVAVLAAVLAVRWRRRVRPEQ